MLPQPYQSLTQLFRRSERQFNPPIIPFKLWRLRMFKEMEPSHKGTFAASEAIEAIEAMRKKAAKGGGMLREAPRVRTRLEATRFCFRRGRFEEGEHSAPGLSVCQRLRSR